MAKDPVLINIYIKIHNKENLTMDDLRYLAKYAPECFEKTCKNVVYNMPETKHVVDPEDEVLHTKTEKKMISSIACSNAQVPSSPEKNFSALEQTSVKNIELSENPSRKIERILENLRHLETKDFPPCNVTSTEVRNLLGNLYMELLFPHNDKDTFFHIDGPTSFFDRKI